MSRLIIICLILSLSACGFLSTETIYKCTGRIHKKEGFTPMVGENTVFLKFIKYGLIIHLWSDSDGSVHTEFPSGWGEYYSHTKIIGDQINIYKGNDFNKLVGNFSFLSNRLNLDSYFSVSIGNGSFEGDCVKRNN